MAKVRRYHRTQTTPEYGGMCYFDCVDCKGVAEVFCLESEKGSNKYIKSGLCPRCFEVAVEAKLRAGDVRVAEIRRAGCVVAKANLEPFTAVAERLNIPVNVIREGRQFVVLDMSAKQYAAVQGTLKQFKDDAARDARGRIARWLRSRWSA